VSLLHAGSKNSVCREDEAVSDVCVSCRCCVQVERTMCAERMKLAVMQGVSPLSAFTNNTDSLPSDTSLRPADMPFVPTNVRRRGALGG